MDLQGTKTQANLQAAFAGESQAHTKYQYYASQASKDGYEQVAAFFLQTSKNEKEHAKLWFKLLHGGKVPTTLDNLQDAAGGENYEHTDMYATFAKEAREEGFEDIARLFEGVGKIEAAHEARYRTLHANITQSKVFAREQEVVWECLNCGHLHYGAHAPDACPVCNHPKAYFEIHATNY
ncbi:MAG: rubrerythrin [Erysipelotrichaceae bacterium]